VETSRLPIADIQPASSARDLVSAKLPALVQSIKAIGLRSPITVRAAVNLVGGRPACGFQIVAGRHRYEAVKQLGWTEIDCFVMEGSADDAELWEIDENFARAELTDAQRADHHARRRRILIDKGIVHAGRGRPDKSANLAVYVDHASETLGMSKRAVERELARGEKITPDVLAEVTGTALDKGVVLDELARTAPADQADKLAEIAARYKAKQPLAADPLNDLEATEKQLAALMSAWNRAGPEAREKFLATVDGPVFDRGRS
jgi:ParB-like chromosome segregation protein Spo0J